MLVLPLEGEIFDGAGEVGKMSTHLGRQALLFLIITEGRVMALWLGDQPGCPEMLGDTRPFPLSRDPPPTLVLQADRPDLIFSVSTGALDHLCIGHTLCVLLNKTITTKNTACLSKLCYIK